MTFHSFLNFFFIDLTPYIGVLGAGLTIGRIRGIAYGRRNPDNGMT